MVTGILRPGRWGYSLEMDGGGVWELDVNGSHRKLLGQRVTVEGTRADFNLLNVRRIVLGDTLPEMPPGIFHKFISRQQKISNLIASLKWDNMIWVILLLLSYQWIFVKLMKILVSH